MAGDSNSDELIVAGAPDRKNLKTVEELDRDKLNKFLVKHNFDAPNYSSVFQAFCQLHQHLHHKIQELKASDPTVLPQIDIFPTGPFMLGIPSKGVPVKLTVFGTISPTLYHDMIWEQIQRTPEYPQFAAGIYEVEKLPVLRFLIHFQGYEFELKYYQSVELVRGYHATNSKNPMLSAPKEFLDEFCTNEVRDLLLAIQRQARHRNRFQNRPNSWYTYYLCRAWASLHGALDEEMDNDIIRVLSFTDKQPDHFGYWKCHPILYKLIEWAHVERLELVPDKKWLEILHHLENIPMSERIGSTHFLTINVMHTGCSNFQAAKWLRYVEGRLPKLNDALNAGVEIPLFKPDPTLLRVAESMKLEGDDMDGPWWKKEEAVESEDEETSDPVPLHLDPSTWNGITGERQAPSEAAGSMLWWDLPANHQANNQASNDAQDPASPPDLPPLAETTNTVTTEEAEATREEMKVRNARKDIRIAQRNHKLQPLKDPRVFQWPFRLVAVGTDPKASDYEGCYLFGLRLGPVYDVIDCTAAVDRWLEIINRHETTLPGNCFIFRDIKLALEFKEQETKNGGLKPCQRILTRSFIPPEKLIEVTDTVPKQPKPQQPSTSQQPTPKLRPAYDILNRLRHDFSYNIDEYFIGYEDRFSSEIMEVPAQSWVRETTHEAFIPESRIWYFKRRWDGKEELVWDRKKKVDRICGSGVKEEVPVRLEKFEIAEVGKKREREVVVIED